MSLASEFKAFLLRGNVVDLAVGVVIGAAFGKIVDAIVKEIFTPVIGLLVGGIKFGEYKLPLYNDAALGVGTVVEAVIQFVIVGFCLFLVVKAMNRLHQREEAKPAEPTPSEKLLAEIRDLLRARG